MQPWGYTRKRQVFTFALVGWWSIVQVRMLHRFVTQGDQYDTYRLLAERRSEDALAALVQFGHDDVLRLVGARLRREVEDVRLVHLLVQLVQQKVLQQTQRTLQQQAHQAQHNSSERFDDTLETLLDFLLFFFVIS